MLIAAAVWCSPTQDPTPTKLPGVQTKTHSHKRLIVNADDLGLSRGITDGILVAHAEGIVTSGSLMVNQPATDYAIDRLPEVPKLDVGVHLNLCQGKPVLPPSALPTLVDSDGYFLRPAEMARRLTFLRASTKEIEAEFCAQIDRMRSYGLFPSHADSHHRFHIYPAAATAFYRAVRSRGITRVRAARKKTWPSNGALGDAHAGPLYRRLAVESYNNLLELAVFHELKRPDAGVALHPRFRGNLAKLPDAWCYAFEHMPAGTYEIWCHPGFHQPGFSETDNLDKQRQLEVRMLTSPQLRESIVQAGIELVAFADL
jgi:predicted glycoside hydrolase/deacetylase ChbG (UPF0249 family)